MPPYPPIDPAPRSYAGGVYLVSRLELPPDDLPACSVKDVENWLLGPQSRQPDLNRVFMEFCCRMQAAGLAVERSTLHAGTLHPQLIGYSWVWSALDGLCDEIQVREAALHTDAYKRNPLSRVADRGETFRARGRDTGPPDSPLVVELFAEGFTDYAIFPLSAGSSFNNPVSIATRQAGGFRDDQLQSLLALLRIFALHVELHVSGRISQYIAPAYLGNTPGRLVHQGQIRRGDGASVSAIIWVSDLRGFTRLSERLPAAEAIAVLNEYFAIQAGAVIDHGGEILKFMGDGLLAVFRPQDFPDPETAAHAALAAVQSALASLSATNNAPDVLSGIDGWRPLRCGIALHRGEVCFGNVGAPQRLDFTVIGDGVNAAARVEALCKGLNEPLLVTEPVAAILDAPMAALGPHGLRGQSRPMAIFAPR